MAEKLFARCSRVRHPSGVAFDTPRLVPSFSSKGFALLRDGESEVSTALKVALEWLNDSMLVSAYDIHYGFIPNPSNLSSTPDITIVDSGGYEASIDHDLSAAIANPYEPQLWKNEQLIQVLESWPESASAIFVSFDHPKSRCNVAEQSERARELLYRFPKQLHSFLLKPETENQKFLDKSIARVLADIDVLRGFHVIGVTEKELGASILDRMLNVARLRRGMDEAGIPAPIQVFGSLDPISSPLYYLAGGEIFDGLTWLRYAFKEGLCVYYSNYIASTESLGISTRESTGRAKAIVDNIGYLKNLEMSMRSFATDGNFSHFRYRNDIFEGAAAALRSKFQGRL